MKTMLFQSSALVALSCIAPGSGARDGFRIEQKEVQDQVPLQDQNPEQFPFPLPNLPIGNPFTKAPTPAPTFPSIFNPLKPLLPLLPPNLGGGDGGGGGGGFPSFPFPSLPSPGELPFPQPGGGASKPACVSMRYVAWDDLPAEMQSELDFEAGYSERSWNVESTNSVESYSWDSLNSGEKSAFTAIGYNEASYDCYVNHYEEYSWDELVSLGVDKNLESLGFEEDMWDNFENPENNAFQKGWDELSTTEQSALDGMCYFEDNWEKNDIEDYTFSC